MSGQPENIERGLRGLTEWEGETPRLWERAIERAERDGDKPVARIRPWYAQRWVFAAASIAALVVISVGLMMPSLGKARASARVGTSPPSRLEGWDVSPSEPEPVPPSEYESSGIPPLSGWGGRDGRGGQPSDDAGATRAVVRKATMEIKTADVRAAALRAQQLLSEPKGEYVESADIDDSNKNHPRADLVLRVEATRLEEVLTQLRELGEVGTERIDGEDVTDQMVDLGARLENERRVERELIELLEARENDELDDILAVRRELNKVREQIERLAAQQDNLARMVRLARVAVMLRAETVAPEPEPEQGVWDLFVEDLGAAWADGLSALLGTVAGFVRVLVGGAIWFAIAALAAALAWRGWRHNHPRALPE